MRVIALAAFALFALAGCAASSETEIELLDNKFEPATATVAVDKDVEFHNEGSVKHNVMIEHDGNVEFDHDLQHDEKVEHEFEHPGVYNVWCKYHGAKGTGMHATITVE